MGTNFDFSGKVAFVTGASRGIGAAVAVALGAAGAQVVLAARTIGGLEETDDAIQAAGGQKATLLPMDLSRLDDVDKVGPTLVERFGKLDLFVGNAGMLGPLSPVSHIAPKDWEKVMRLNFFANARLVRSCDPLLRASDAGRLVFITSDIAQKPPAYWGPYAASKAALNAFVQAYAAETLQTNMKVNAIAPGAVETKMLLDAFPGGPEFAMRSPEDVAPDILELLGDDCARHGGIIACES